MTVFHILVNIPLIYCKRHHYSNCIPGFLSPGRTLRCLFFFFISARRNRIFQRSVVFAEITFAKHIGNKVQK